MDKIHSVHSAKTHLSKLLERAEAGESIVIARGKIPAARLVPVKSAPPHRKFAAMKGRSRVTRAFFSLLPDDELKSWGSLLACAFCWIRTHFYGAQRHLCCVANPSYPRDMFQTFKYRNIMTEDLVAFFNAQTGKNLKPLFDQYLRHTALPVLELKFDEAARNVSYRWKVDEPAFNMPIKVGSKTAWQIILGQECFAL